MRARRVKRLDPQGALADNAERIVLTRLDELCGFVPAVLDPRAVRELHDMRIAAKRLRYVLEVTASPCFGPYARVAARRARELQDLLGEIHDCDVQLPRVEALVAELRDADAAELRARAGDAPDIDPQHAARLPSADAWRGLMTLDVHLRARRELLYERFKDLWRDLERDGFRARLEYAARERPGDEAAPEEPAEAVEADEAEESKPRVESGGIDLRHADDLEPPAEPAEQAERPAEAPPPPIAPSMASGAPEAPVGPAIPPPAPAAPPPPPAPRPLHSARGGIHPTIPIGSPEAPTGPPAPDPDERPEDRA